jgi:hypothetical protein
LVRLTKHTLILPFIALFLDAWNIKKLLYQVNGYILHAS